MVLNAFADHLADPVSVVPGRSPIDGAIYGGIGLRIFNSRTAFGNVVHADLAFPLNPDPGIKKVQFLLTTKVSF